MARQPADRPDTCKFCHAALTPAATGRPRITCSDRCRQALRRRMNYLGWRDPQAHARASRAADRELARIEKRTGSLAVPEGAYLTLRDRLRIRLMRGEELPFCRVCGMPYVVDTSRKHPVCSKKCRRRYLDHNHAVLDAMCYWRKCYDRAIEPHLYAGEMVPLCAHCGKPFLASSQPRKYCSDSCRKAAWWQRNPHWACTECGAACPGRRHQCSHNCAARYHRRTGQFCARCHHAVPRGSEILPNAGTRFPPLPAVGEGTGVRGRPVVFCSGRCRDALGWSPIRKMCDECHQSYYPTVQRCQNRQRFCSEPCRDRYNKRVKAARREARRPPHICAHCGDPFTVTNPRSHQRLYCDPCRRIVSRELKRASRAARRQQPIPIPLHVFIPDYAYAGDK